MTNEPTSVEQSGFFDLPGYVRICVHHEHNMPTYICIPPGKGYRHVCPVCGEVQVAYGAIIFTTGVRHDQ